MPWCKAQHFAHYYIYVPLLAVAYLFLAIDSLIHFYKKDSEILLEKGEPESENYKAITWGYIRGVLQRGAKFFLGAFLIIFLAQNSLWPFSWLPETWQLAIKAFLGF
jgi:hypothetical protein